MPGIRVLFRVPKGPVGLHPGNVVIESGWRSDATRGQDAGFLKRTDTHITKIVKTPGGNVTRRYDMETKGKTAFDPKESPLLYTNAIWAAA